MFGVFFFCIGFILVPDLCVVHGPHKVSGQDGCEIHDQGFMGASRLNRQIEAEACDNVCKFQISHHTTRLSFLGHDFSFVSLPFPLKMVAFWLSKSLSLSNREKDHFDCNSC